MDQVPLTSFPEVQERLIFPFYRPRELQASGSPKVQAASTREVVGPISSGERQKRPTARSYLHASGVVIEERLSGRHLLQKQEEFIPGHKYSCEHSFGHHLPANDINPLFAHSRIPAHSRSSDEYGRHYQHHKHQDFARGANFRLPLPAGISVTDADRFRAQTSLMFQ